MEQSMTAATGSATPAKEPTILTPIRRRAVRHAMVIAGVVAAVMAAWINYYADALDAHAYYFARAPGLYDALPGTPLAYLYSPVFAQVLAPLQRLPEDLFVALWLAAIVLCLAWLAGPRLLWLAVVVAWGDIQSANIHTFMAVAIVLSFRYPAAWAFPLLTKVTPGIGMLWYPLRREWRSLAIAVGATAAIVGVSFIADPQSWFDWIDLLRRSAGAEAISLSALTPLWLRLAIAAVVVIVGAGRNAKWTVPIAAMLALPVIWPASLALLVAIIPLADKPAWRPSWRQAFA
jgi:Glycosyltransferase family 87